MTDGPAELDPQLRKALRLALLGGSMVTARLLSEALFIVVLLTQSRFGKVFAEFGFPLPVLTKIVRSGLFLWLLGALLGLTIFLDWRLRNSDRREPCNTVAVIVILALGALYVIGMFLPLVMPLQNLSK
jgi:hypothetical protein